MKILAACALLLTAAALQDARPLATRARCRSAAAAAPWGKNLKQIPSTVIDTGVLRHVPYASYRADDYEVNVYGDPAAPACFEIGIHGALLKSAEAKRRCVEFVSGLLGDASDRQILASLKMEVDKQMRAGLTFEVTPPTAPDAYGGWWISVYSEKELDRSRATPKEMERITTTRGLVKRAEDSPLQVDSATRGRWEQDDLAGARNRKDLPEEKQAVYAPAFSRKNGVYVPDRSVDDTGYILFICANSDKHEDREEILKSCPSCKKEETFFWDAERKCFIAFQCGAAYENALVKCSICSKPPRRVRTKHK